MPFAVPEIVLPPVLSDGGGLAVTEVGAAGRGA